MGRRAWCHLVVSASTPRLSTLSTVIDEEGFNWISTLHTSRYLSRSLSRRESSRSRRFVRTKTLEAKKSGGAKTAPGPSGRSVPQVSVCLASVSLHAFPLIPGTQNFVRNGRAESG